jgi:hypothetical protein
MAWHCIALHYIDEVGTGDRTAVAGALQQEVIYSEEDLKRQEESNDLRRAVLPVRLMEQVSNKWAFAPSTEILPGNAQRRRRRSWGVVNSLVINLAMVICFLLFLVCLFSSVLSLSLATLLLNNNNNNTGSRIHKSSNQRQNEFCCRMTSCLRIVNSRERDRAS